MYVETPTKDAAQLVKDNIKRKIKQDGRTIAEVCRSMGVNRTYISSISSGTRLTKLYAIACAININMADLFKFEYTVPPTQ